MYTKIPKYMEMSLIFAGAALAAFLAWRFLLPALGPFLVAAAAAAALEGAVCRLSRHLPRPAAAGLCVLALLGLIFALAWLGLSRLGEEARALSARLPDMAQQVFNTLELWRGKLSTVLGQDGESRAYLEKAASGVGQALGEVPAKLSAKLLSFMALAAAKAPAALLFAVTAVIGTYFLSASYPQVKLFLSRQLSENVRAKAGRVKVLLRTTIGRYFRAQLIMTAIVFVFLGVAFALLKINYALLLSLLTAVIDALPVLGTGTVLIPWALYELLTGNVGLGLGLGITYAVVTVLRSCIQAKLLGDQLGLHPLSTLLAIYVGYSFAGVWGMIIFPILAITVKQLNDAGLVKLWKTSEEEKHDRGNIEYSGRHGNEHSGRNEYPSR